MLLAFLNDKNDQTLSAYKEKNRKLLRAEVSKRLLKLLNDKRKIDNLQPLKKLPGVKTMGLPKCPYRFDGLPHPYIYLGHESVRNCKDILDALKANAVK